MELRVQQASVTEIDTPLLVVSAFEGEAQPSGVTSAVDAALGVALHAIPGVIEHGLFFGMARAAIVGSATGVRILGELP